MNITDNTKTTNQKPGFHILICLMEIWKPENPLDFTTQPLDNSCLRITEVGSAVMDQSFKELIWGADFSFPRGTVIHKTITQIEEEKKNGETSDYSIVQTTVDGGVVVEKRTTTKAATVADFSVGSRVRFYCGYTTDPKIADLGRCSLPPEKTIFGSEENLKNYKKAMEKTFDGFIAKCSVAEPIEIHCENIASVLKKMTCPDYKPKKHISLGDIFGEGSKVNLLGKTKLKIHSQTASKMNTMMVYPAEFTPDMTVADWLINCGKGAGLYARVCDDNGEPALKIGYTFMSGLSSDETDATIQGNGSKQIKQIFFDYNVAKDGLEFVNVDPNFLALKATMEIAGDKGKQSHYSITIRRNPEFKDTDDPKNEFQIINETKLSKKLQQAGASKQSRNSKSVDLSSYTVVSRFYPQIMKTADTKKLKEWAIKQFKDYKQNGIDGNLTLFGDLDIHTGDQVELIDNRHPNRNGVYLVDKVNTTFGVDGYRQTITIPYRISKTENNPQHE